MESTYLWKREFVSGPEAALKSAEQGPVYVAQDGWPTHVLLNYEDYAAMVRLARLPDVNMDQLMISFRDDEFAEPTPEAGSV
jgi:PHD/YefM family antitoxin component YafN of YafNO toxin-antitoxin module